MRSRCRQSLSHADGGFGSKPSVLAIAPSVDAHRRPNTAVTNAAHTVTWLVHPTCAPVGRMLANGIVRVVCISDTHNRHLEIAMPDGDVLLHAGDLTMHGTLFEIVIAFAWLSRLPYDRIVVTPGNHDCALEEPVVVEHLHTRFPRVEVLIDAATEFSGLRVWGAPWQPWFHNWAFNLPRAGTALTAKWALVPTDTAILLTHGPPLNVLDRTGRGEHVGCEKLAERVAQLPALRLSVFGHIHEARGTVRGGNVTYVNASICDARYRAAYSPIVVDVNT